MVVCRYRYQKLDLILFYFRLNKKREFKNKKFGFGGQKKRLKFEEKKYIEISYNKIRYKLYVIISISCISFLKINYIKILLKCFIIVNQILRFIKLIELYD